MAIEKIIHAIGNLPPFPAVIGKVTTLLSDEDYDTAQVAATINRCVYVI